MSETGMMAVKSVHVSQAGEVFLIPDADGYVTYHDNERYENATDAELDRWYYQSECEAVKNAASLEMNRRGQAMADAEF